MRGRGLKLAEAWKNKEIQRVALHAGAWIETTIVADLAPDIKSPSMRGRGLKHDRCDSVRDTLWSPSMRGRGLKLVSKHLREIGSRVALHAGAWIETWS